MYYALFEVRVICSSQHKASPVFMELILEKTDSKRMSKYMIWRVVVKLTKGAMSAVYKVLFFSGQWLIFKFPPFYLFGS